MSEWSDGFEAGYSAAAGKWSDRPPTPKAPIAHRPKTKRNASAYSIRYGKAFKRLAPKFKKKSGGWKKNGFKRCAAAARRAAKK